MRRDLFAGSDSLPGDGSVPSRVLFVAEVMTQIAAGLEQQAWEGDDT